MDKLGIEPTLLAAQVVNFLVIIFVLQKLLFKPILTMLDKRRREISEGIATTEKIKRDEENFREKQDKALAKARDEAMKIIEDAKSQAKDVEKEVTAEAHIQATAILSRAKTDAMEMHKAKESAIRREAIELGVVMTKRLLESILNAKDQHVLIAKRLNDLERWAIREKKASSNT